MPTVSVRIETGLLWVQGFSGLHSEVWAILGYTMSKTLSQKTCEEHVYATILNHIDVLSDYVIVRNNYTVMAHSAQ